MRMRIAVLNYTSCICLIFGLFACMKSASKNSTATTMAGVEFSADSAYHFVQQQVDFGARVPNSAAHAACALYLAETLTRFGAEVTVQKASLTAFDGTLLHAQNIIGSYRPELTKRILLCAHWDSRPWADHDLNSANHRTPVMGANDGASGVGVLLEIARQLQQQPPSVGVDILFFDAEDYGIPEFYNGAYREDTWCLGSQYWAKHPHVVGYRADYGILLDMVGAPDATFPMEAISAQYAPQVVQKVWSTAASLGFGHLFVNQKGAPITDDHLYVNLLAQIPCIDIIDYNPRNRNGFFSAWHTVEDDMRHISKNTLFAVGKTVLTVLHNE